MAPSLIPCATCGCHVKSTDPTCPSCGEPIRRGDGAVQRSAVAMLMSLTAAGAFAAACSSGPVVSQTGTSSGAGGAGTSTTNGSGNAPVTLYGPAMTSSSGSTSTSSGEPVLYGPAMTTSSTGSGTGGGSTGGNDGGTADGG